ncbi:MAG: MutT/nudix family protein [Candidatus Saccharibacteria bacterium]|nr:MutT/nudix family protein [Candidatus Saccharibacteria bacterium]
MKPFKEAVSLVIVSSDNKFLAVKRPDNPSDDLAGVWGFPAVTLNEGESHDDGAARVGRQKLGVDIMLGEKIGESTHDRGTYTLHLTDYRAEIVDGEPVAPQDDTSVTQYSECKYSDDPIILIPAAKRGSQCTQLFLESLGIDWESHAVTL